MFFFIAPSPWGKCKKITFTFKVQKVLKFSFIIYRPIFASSLVGIQSRYSETFWLEFKPLLGGISIQCMDFHPLVGNLSVLVRILTNWMEIRPLCPVHPDVAVPKNYQYIQKSRSRSQSRDLRHFFLIVSVSVSKNLVLEKKVSVSVSKNLVSLKKVSVSVSENLVSEKSLGIGLRNFCLG